jgi:ATPase family associated with various cellular activities (AAA)
VRPTQVAESIKLLVAKKRTAFIWGPPGAGKSDVVRQVARDIKHELIDIRLSMLDPTDLKGFPIADREREVMRWLTADFLPRDPKWKGIVFFDEANAAAKSVEAPMYQLTLDRKLGDYELPPGAAIVLAGNRETDRAIANRMSAALTNRLVHIEYEINVDDWCTWAIEHKIENELLGFMRFRPELLHKFDANSKAYPTPRSWMFASELVRSGLTRDTEFELLKGTVGEGAAGEFAAFMDVYRDLPSIDQILLKPDSIPVPDSPGTLYALTTALAAKTGKDNFDRLMKYVGRMQMEFQVVFIRDTVRRKVPIENNKAFIQWSIANADVLT